MKHSENSACPINPSYLQHQYGSCLDVAVAFLLHQVVGPTEILALLLEWLNSQHNLLPLPIPNRHLLGSPYPIESVARVPIHSCSA